ncbi:hypothetical protein DL897_03805 [Thermoflavimicrobium daqui]|uniref:Uncharacterized protein n=1 Tax=Thermoflavimicrobium daqui TaxID=2137476 RepID=A0A364K755_9BACL|nr:hypothetical protein DL897_03805 [Thermoflavimicrobium daqui]
MDKSGMKEKLDQNEKNSIMNNWIQLFLVHFIANKSVDNLHKKKYHLLLGTPIWGVAFYI